LVGDQEKRFLKDWKMIVIADSNIIISALISPKGSIASVLKNRSNVQFIAPDYLLTEVYEHWDIIVQFTTLSKRELFEEFYFYRGKITFINTDTIPIKHMKNANEIVKDIDEDDVDFVALHLYKKHKLWTGDKNLIKGLTAKGYGHIFVSTAELKEKLYKR